MSAYGVVGSCFGDEGKGLVTDYLASKLLNNIVVRSNGGSQAGHTVTTENKRHVFSHFGSGSFVNSPTYLSEYFISNPLIFVKELEELKSKGIHPKVYVDKNSLLTLPFDMLINQEIENQRGDKKHGSCGLGINETITRCQDERFKTTIDDLYDKATIYHKMIDIFLHYFPKRCKELDIDETKIKNIYIKSINNFILDLEIFTIYINKVDINILNKYKRKDHNIIFEGAQGLLLDEDHHWFPHVTRSKTGIHNMTKILNSIGENELEVFYVTRSYLTRHGAGPLPVELDKKPYEKIIDKTNIPNEFQGSLRFSYMNYDLLARSIINDKRKNNNVKIKDNLVVTCIDQVDENFKCIFNNEIKEKNIYQSIQDLCDILYPSKCYGSYGPTRNSIYNLEFK